MVQRRRAVLALVCRIVSQRISDLFRLIHEPRADGPRVDLDQADQIWIQKLQVLSNPLQHSGVAAQVPRARNGQVKGGPCPGCVPDVVQNETHELGGGGLDVHRSAAFYSTTASLAPRTLRY